MLRDLPEACDQLGGAEADQRVHAEPGVRCSGIFGRAFGEVGLAAHGWAAT